MSAILLHKERILKLIQTHDTNITYVKPTTASSLVWKKFSYVHINNKNQNFVSCDTCKDILHHKSIDGTSSMMKHLRSCDANTKSKNKNNDGIPIKEYFSPQKTRSVPSRFTNKVLQVTTELVVMDCRAFELITGSGFLSFTQVVFDVGHAIFNAQKIDVSELLPHPTTVNNFSYKF